MQKTENEVIVRLKNLLLSKGWSWYDLAKKTGISANSVYSWKNLGKMPSFANIERVCKVAEITVEQFFMDNSVDTLSSKEKELLAEWITLSECEKKAIFATFDAFKEAKRV